MGRVPVGRTSFLEAKKRCCPGTKTLLRLGGGAGWLFPFSFQFFTCLAAVFAEEVGGFGVVVGYGPI